MATKISGVFCAMGRLWCRLMHSQISWPIHGRYRCLVCFREYEVCWADRDVRCEPAHAAHPIAGRFAVPGWLSFPYL